MHEILNIDKEKNYDLHLY